MRILVVENSRRMQEAMRIALSAWGEVDLCNSAADAKDFFQRVETVDVVFTDFHMRGGSGLEVVDYVNEFHPGVPVVVLTAYGTKELTIDCLNRKVFKFLEKPVNYDDLMEVVAEAGKLKERSISEKRAQNLGTLANLIFHEIGGGLQDLLNEVQSVNLSSIKEERSTELVQRFQKVRNDIYEMADACRNLKFLLHERHLNSSEVTGIDLTHILNRTSDWLANWTDAYGITASFEIPEESVIVSGLPGLTERAIKNLLINAVEALATYDGQRVILVTCQSESNGNATLSIRNSGPPMPPEIQSKIFMHSFSTKGANSAPRGIGLYVVDKVMRIIGGQVDLQSDSEWTEFNLHFSVP